MGRGVRGAGQHGSPWEQLVGEEERAVDLRTQAAPLAIEAVGDEAELTADVLRVVRERMAAARVVEALVVAGDGLTHDLRGVGEVRRANGVTTGLDALPTNTLRYSRVRRSRSRSVSHQVLASTAAVASGRRHMAHGTPRSQGSASTGSAADAVDPGRLKMSASAWYFAWRRRILTPPLE